jgi:hypothetical protein
VECHSFPKPTVTYLRCHSESRVSLKGYPLIISYPPLILKYYASEPEVAARNYLAIGWLVAVQFVSQQYSQPTVCLLFLLCFDRFSLVAVLTT